MAYNAIHLKDLFKKEIEADEKERKRKKELFDIKSDSSKNMLDTQRYVGMRMGPTHYGPIQRTKRQIGLKMHPSGYGIKIGPPQMRLHSDNFSRNMDVRSIGGASSGPMGAIGAMGVLGMVSSMSNNLNEQNKNLNRLNEVKGRHKEATLKKLQEQIAGTNKNISSNRSKTSRQVHKDVTNTLIGA